MKEQEYINVRELSITLAVLNLLREIVVANSEVIKEEELRAVGETVYQWQQKLFKKIYITDKTV